MKRILASILTVVMLVVCCSCNGHTPNPEPGESTTVQVTSSSKEDSTTSHNTSDPSSSDSSTNVSTAAGTNGSTKLNGTTPNSSISEITTDMAKDTSTSSNSTDTKTNASAAAGTSSRSTSKTTTQTRTTHTSTQRTTAQNITTQKPTTVSTTSSGTTTPTTKPSNPNKPDSGALSPAKPLIGNQRIKKVATLTENPTALAMVEFDLQIDGITGNVYDPDNVSLDMELKSSNGKTMHIIGFYFVPHTIEANKNVGGQSGNPSWRFRFTPLNEGTWDFTITLAEKGKTVDTISGYINVSPTADTRGFLSVEPIKKQVFTFEDGTLFVPVGENVAWYGVNSNAVYSYYDTVNQKLHANGANHVRTWLASWCLSIITGGRAPRDLSGGMQRAIMLDKIMESCAENEIYLSFCIYHHGMFSNGADPDWNGSPYNKNNNSNGYLNSPEQFFTDERAKKDCKLYIRYLIARYGYSRNILTWELINEIDQSNAKNLSDGGLQWHREMTAYIRSIDPYGHMVSTSAARNQNPIPFDDIFDFVQVHWYTYGDLHNLMNVQRNGYSRVHKPILFAEAGVFEGGNQIAMTSSTPVMVHQQHWIGVMGGGAGTGMTWYWEEFERYNCYYLFNGISAFSKRIPWADANRKDYTATASNNGNIRIVGYTGNAYAYLWLYDNTYKHERQGSGITYSNITFKVNIEKAGTYQVEWIDTWTNTVIKTETLTTSNGTLHLNSPAWARDVAVAITTQ